MDPRNPWIPAHGSPLAMPMQPVDTSFCLYTILYT